MHLCEPFLCGAPHAYFGAPQGGHRLKSAALDTYLNRSLCPARNASCHICGKRGHFARVSRSKGSSNDFASAAITAPVPSVHRPFLASAPASLGSAVVPGTLNDSSVYRLSLTLALLKTSSTLTFAIDWTYLWMETGLQSVWLRRKFLLKPSERG